MAYKFFSSLLSNPNGSLPLRFSGPWVWKNLSNDKKCKFCEKKAKNLDSKTLQTIPLPLETVQ